MSSEEAEARLVAHPKPIQPNVVENVLNLTEHPEIARLEREKRCVDAFDNVKSIIKSILSIYLVVQIYYGIYSD